VQQLALLSTEEMTRLDGLSREELVELIALQQKWNNHLAERLKKAEALSSVTSQERMTIEEQVILLRYRIYGKSSEKSAADEMDEEPGTKKKKRRETSLLPSRRYPDLALVETEVRFEKAPPCGLCGEETNEMNQAEVAEFLSVVPKVFHIVQQKRAKYRCGKCHGDIRTAPLPPRIVTGGAFSDSLIADVIVSKYADHCPIERYARIAEREGVRGLPPQTLIEQTHKASDFLLPVYRDLKKEIEAASFLHADETSWRMMEGSPKKRWQLWGFFTGESAYYEAHDTRAGSIVEEFLQSSLATHIVSDAYSGYRKSVKAAGKKSVFCHAHARRKFVEAELVSPEATRVIELYKDIYRIEAEISERSTDEKYVERRARSEPILKELLAYVMGLNPLPKSALGKARHYLIDHWQELTAFLEDGRLPVDNNLAERGLRGPVIGRKNFFGNHSQRGAETTAVLYSIIESAKLNGLDPYKYLVDTIARRHRGEPMLTPAAYATLMG
jgi:transposase